MEPSNVSEHTLIIIALIPSLATIAVAWVNKRAHSATRAKVDDNTQKTQAVLHQVRNDHKTNLRDDLDGIKSEINKKLEQIENAQAYLGKSLGLVLKDVKRNLRHQQSHEAASELLVEQLTKKDEELHEAIIGLQERFDQK